MVAVHHVGRRERSGRDARHGVDPRTVIGASIDSVIACSCGSAVSFLEGGLTNVRLAIVPETATTLGISRVCSVGLVLLARPDIGAPIIAPI